MNLQSKGAWIQASPIARLGHLAEARGLAWDELLASHNLDAAQVDNPDILVSVETMLAIFNRVAEETGNDAEILDLFYDTPVGFSHGYDYVGLCAPTVRDALKNWADVTLLRSNCAKTVYSETPQFAKLEWVLPAHFGGFVQFSLAFLGWLIRRTEILLDERYEELTIHLSSPKPQSPSPILQRYGSRVKFSQPDHAVLVPVHLLNRRPPTADPVLLQIILQHVHRTIGERAAEHSPIVRVTEAISRQIHSGDCSVVTVANDLGMSRRSLQRFLEGEGTTFRDLMTDVRRSMAEKYLLETELQMKEIAFLLGFADLSTFSRAVKSWFGVPPKSVHKRVHDLPSARTTLLRPHR